MTTTTATWPGAAYLFELQPVPAAGFQSTATGAALAVALLLGVGFFAWSTALARIAAEHDQRRPRPKGPSRDARRTAWATIRLWRGG